LLSKLRPHSVDRPVEPIILVPARLIARGSGELAP